MILVISNRNINNDFDNENYFGNQLIEGSASTGMAIAEYSLVEDLDDFDEDGDIIFDSNAAKYAWKLKPVASNDNALFGVMLEQISSGTLKKNWVFFVHGNNQTTFKNLEKCREIEQLHDVNVIAFSWPSWRGRLFSIELFKMVAPDILKQGKIGPGILTSIISKGIELKQQHYGEAVEIAKESRVALHNTLKHIISQFILPVRESIGEEFSINLLVHSLGNRVLQKMIEDENLDDITQVFDNVILHQADVNTKGHDKWVRNINMGERVYITHNRKDVVLHISDIFGSNPKRLGHKSGGNRCSKKEVTAYIDFTKGYKVGLNHGLFLMRDIFSGKVNDCFNDLLAGESLFTGDNLPVGFVKENNNTYTMKKERFIEEEEDYWYLNS